MFCRQWSQLKTNCVISPAHFGHLTEELFRTCFYTNNNRPQSVLFKFHSVLFGRKTRYNVCSNQLESLTGVKKTCIVFTDGYAFPNEMARKIWFSNRNFWFLGSPRDHSAGFLKRLDCITIYQTRLFTHVQYTQTDTIRQTNGPLKRALGTSLSHDFNKHWYTEFIPVLLKIGHR